MFDGKALIAAIVGLTCLGPVAAQDINFACKAVDGWKYESNGSRDPKLAAPGKCDAAGLLQGDAFARDGGGGREIRLRSNFVDGRPTGPSVLGFFTRSAPACAMKFSRDGVIEGDIACTAGDINGDWPQGQVQFQLSSTSGFVLSTDKHGSKFISAQGVLYTAKGHFGLGVNGRSDGVNGEITGTTDFDNLPLVGLWQIRLKSGRLTVQSEGYKKRNPVTWVKAVSGPLEVGSSVRLSKNWESTRSLMLPTPGQGTRQSYPAELEISVEYADGTSFRGIYLGDRQYLAYQDSRGVQFNGMVDECLQPGRRPGRITLDGNDAELGLSNRMRPEGCAGYKTATSAEARGIFAGEGTLKPF